MELSEALKTIDATFGMFRFILNQVQNGEMKKEFLLCPIESSTETYWDIKTDTQRVETRLYYTYVEDYKEHKAYIVDITPVCNCLINEWPSDKSKRIRTIMEEVFFNCFSEWKDYLAGGICAALEEGYDYDRYYVKRSGHLSFLYEAMIGSLHEMHHALGFTEDTGDYNTNLGTPSPRRRYRKIKLFHEFVKDAEKTDEIVGKLHRLIGNKTDTEALREIKIAMDLDLLNRPTATSIRNEFPTITCSDTIVSNVLKEPKPTHPSMIEKIRKEFEQA